MNGRGEPELERVDAVYGVVMQTVGVNLLNLEQILKEPRHVYTAELQPYFESFTNDFPAVLDLFGPRGSWAFGLVRFLCKT